MGGIHSEIRFMTLAGFPPAIQSAGDERILLWRFMRGGCNIASDASSLVSSDLAHMQL